MKGTDEIIKRQGKEKKIVEVQEVDVYG